MDRRSFLSVMALGALAGLASGCGEPATGVSQAEPRTEEDIRKLYGGGPAGGPEGPEAKAAAKKKAP